MSFLAHNTSFIEQMPEPNQFEPTVSIALRMASIMFSFFGAMNKDLGMKMSSFGCVAAFETAIGILNKEINIHNPNALTCCVFSDKIGHATGQVLRRQLNM